MVYDDFWSENAPTVQSFETNCNSVWRAHAGIFAALTNIILAARATLQPRAKTNLASRATFQPRATPI